MCLLPPTWGHQNPSPSTFHSSPLSLKKTIPWNSSRVSFTPPFSTTHSVFLPGEPHGQRSLAGYSPGATRVGHALATKPPPHHHPARLVPSPHPVLVSSRATRSLPLPAHLRVHCPLATWPAPCGPDWVRLVQATTLARDTAQGSLAARIQKAHQRAGAME